MGLEPVSVELKDRTLRYHQVTSLFAGDPGRTVASTRWKSHLAGTSGQSIAEGHVGAYTWYQKFAISTLSHTLAAYLMHAAGVQDDVVKSLEETRPLPPHHLDAQSPHKAYVLSELVGEMAGALPSKEMLRAATDVAYRQGEFAALQVCVFVHHESLGIIFHFALPNRLPDEGMYPDLDKLAQAWVWVYDISIGTGLIKYSFEV